MNTGDIKLLRKHGWEVECMSPFEIRYEDGGAFASGLAAQIILDNLRKQEEGVQKSIKSLEDLNNIELEPIYHTTHCQYSTIENKLATIYKNQEKILDALKLIGNQTINYEIDE